MSHRPDRLHRWERRPAGRQRGAGLVALVTLLGLACTDPVPPVTAPPEQRAPSIPRTPPGVSATYDPVPGGTVTLPLGDSVTAQASAALPYFQHTTLVRVTITGSLTTRLTPFNDGNPNSPQAPGAPRTFGPEGYYWGSSQVNGCGAGVYVAWVLGEGRWPACAADGSTDGTGSVVAHLYARDHGSAVRTAVALGTSGPNDCFYYAPDFFSGYGPCFYYATPGQQITVERVHAEASLTVATPLPVLAGDSVTFVAAVTPEVVENKALNNSVSGWEWTPEGGTPTPVCTAAATWTCRIPVTKPGTMKVTGLENGQSFERTAQAQVFIANVVIAPKPASGAVGERLQFTATIIPATKPNGDPVPWSVADWRWRSPSGWEGYACQEPPMPTICTNPWTLIPDHNGSRVWVRAVINGVPDADTTEVIVVPCPTGNLILDDPDIRSALKAQQALSVSEGLERGGWIFRNEITGRYQLVEDLSPTRTACEHKFSNAPPLSLPPEWKPVSLWHTHPKNPGDPLHCPSKLPGTPAGNGPSPEDRKAVRDAGRPLITMDNNEVWYTSHPTQTQSPAWRHTGTGAACQW